MNSDSSLRPIIIAIDGFSSSGKSTMAKALAKTIGYRYIDSGAMYRAVTLHALRHGLIAPDGTIDEAALVASLPDLSIDFRPGPDGQHTLLNGEDVEKEIRTMEVSDHVSPVAAIAAVRRDLVRRQQQFGAEKGIVMDGRDVGTTIFPNAELKIFVNAAAETRARRRYEELRAKGMEADYEKVLENVRSRDHIDMTRAESPLRRAADAIDIDNSSMTPDEQNAWLLAQFRNAAAD